MIVSVDLVPSLKEVNSSNAPACISLWPSKRKAIKVTPDFRVKEYYFCVKSIKELNAASIVINEFESIELHLMNTDQGEFEYRSPRLKTQNFLGFNLGIMELNLITDIDSYALTTINNKDNKFTNDNLNYMYESVAKSDFFALYISNYSRANLSAKVLSEDTNKHFWITISNANALLKEVNLFITGELAFISRVNKLSVISKHNDHSIVEEENIEWLTENPNEMTLSDSGVILINGIRYQIENISQSIMTRNFDTYENRLLISCLYSIRNALSDLMFEYQDTKLFPHKSIGRIIEDTDKVISLFNDMLNIAPPFDTLPEFSNKYIDDVRYIKLFELISKWYVNNNLTIGNELRSPILGITTIFEHFCFITLIDCLTKKGFKVHEVSFKDEHKAGSVHLKKEEEEIFINYEPMINIDAIYPLITSKLTSYYTPDITIIYKAKDRIKCGVIDSKFSDAANIKELAEHIYFKYGLFLHRPNDNNPIDYVWAMYPSVSENAEINYSRNGKLRDLIKPSLGYFSVPLNEFASEKISDFVFSLITSN